jgi:putative MATE family efflux protein
MEDTSVADGGKFGEKFETMTTAPVERLIVRFAIPAVIINLITALYNMADTFFVGSLGTSAIGGVGVSFPLMAILQAVGFFFGQGSGTFVSRQLGERNLKEASRMAATGFISSLLTGFAICALGIAFLDRLSLFLGATPTILPYAKSYLFYILLAAPWLASSLTLNNLLRFQGSAATAMIGMTSGAVLNVFLDPLFIFVFKFGVGGAAMATMISQFIGFCLLVGGCSTGGNIRIKIRDFTPTLRMYAEILKGGAPSLFRQSLSSVATICVNRLAGAYGDEAIAAMSIVTRVVMFSNFAMLGIGQGFQPVCGFNYGAKLYGRVKRAFWFCVRSSCLTLAALSVFMWFFAPEVVAVFRHDDPEVIRIGAFALRLQFVTSVLMGWVVMNNMLFQTTGHAWPASSVALARQGLFLLPILFALSHALGLLGIQLSQPIADAATFVLSVPVHMRVMRGMSPPPSEPKR